MHADGLAYTPAAMDRTMHVNEFSGWMNLDDASQADYLLVKASARGVGALRSARMTKLTADMDQVIFEGCAKVMTVPEAVLTGVGVTQPDGIERITKLTSDMDHVILEGSDEVVSRSSSPVIVPEAA